ncbi:hypothetical protein SAV14893_091990 [Streptomyces avermitilis]|uniref:Uncharacterized protein n=1 Tax=Streptomyces avermitilis TaxID=33903 RepID=A0A4D4N6M0_STRAX|nr:hypothetical protein SAVMC3_04480 [Streptomyces avermitilis]GDY69806.1 hypothetical protein SAV14893_091990 [Streptomyces avermitilis]GDY80073.1 hypothetical protein SAV31267_095580 [Streptomyces avermitilis]
MVPRSNEARARRTRMSGGLHIRSTSLTNRWGDGRRLGRRGAELDRVDAAQLAGEPLFPIAGGQAAHTVGAARPGPSFRSLGDAGPLRHPVSSPEQFREQQQHG